MFNLVAFLEDECMVQYCYFLYLQRILNWLWLPFSIHLIFTPRL